MKRRIMKCDTVGNAWMVIEVSRFGRIRKVAIGLTEWEAKALVKRKDYNS